MRHNTTSDLIFKCFAVIALAIGSWAALHSSSRYPPQVAGSDGPILNSVLHTGTIRVAVVPAPPIAAIDPTSREPSGYAIDVMKALARNAGLIAEFHPADWSSFGAEISSAKADIAIGPIFFTEGRAKDLGFTSPLFAYGIVAIAPAGRRPFISAADLNQKGIRISVGKGGFDEEFVKRRMPDAIVKAFPPGDSTLPLLEVVSGRADVALADHATALSFVREHPEVAILFDGVPISVQYAGFVVDASDQRWRDFINNGLRNLDLSGELEQLDATYADRKNWFGRVSQRQELLR